MIYDVYVYIYMSWNIRIPTPHTHTHHLTHNSHSKLSIHKKTKNERTNQESALSTPGIQQNEQACKMLKDRGIAPTIIRYSLAANAIATSDTVARQLLVSGGYRHWLVSVYVCWGIVWYAYIFS